MTAEAVTIRAAAELAEALRDAEAVIAHVVKNGEQSKQSERHLREVNVAIRAALARWEAREAEPPAALGVRLREIEARADQQACRFKPDDCECGVCAMRRDVYALAAELERVTAELDQAHEDCNRLLEEMQRNGWTTPALETMYDCRRTTASIRDALAAAVAESERLAKLIAVLAAVAVEEGYATDPDYPEVREAIHAAEALAGGAAAPPPECHICHLPLNGPGGIFCSAAHGPGSSAVASNGEET